MPAGPLYPTLNYVKISLMDSELVTLNGRYKLLSRAGSGGMATVYKAQDLMLGRLVAVKVLHQSLTHDEAFLRRFEREARAAANLAHPNIVTVHDIGQDGFRHYIVMEYVAGRTLKVLLREHMGETGQPLPIAQALDLLVQVCAGVGYAHRAGLVHCDVKPQNVLVTADKRIKVADFGIARAISQASLHDASLLWGTPHYFAPEQAAGQTPTPASDVYALGVILFEMLSGRLPFEADTLPGLALAHLHEPPPLITDYNPAVPDQLARIINKVLSKEPAGRYRTAGQLEAILRTYRDSSEQQTGAVVPVPAPVSAMPPAPRPEEPDPSDATPTRQSPPLSEWSTEVYQRSVAPPRPPAAASPVVEAPRPGEETDWVVIMLGFIAILFLLGLIPLWVLVFQAWTG